jgi:ubiquinone/menaquinone biosynthesis C-methylase UbiE
MFKRIAHRLAAIPAVYDAVQYLNGGAYTYGLLRRHLAAVPAGALLLDVGGGTGLVAGLLTTDCHYLCIEPDSQKLGGQRVHLGRAVQGDGCHLPVAASCADWVVLMSVLHHLDGRQLPALLREVRRALKPGGRLLVLEPVWDPRRPIGRLLWAYDRGAHPRTEAAIVDQLAAVGRLEERFGYAINHRCVLCVVAKVSE